MLPHNVEQNVLYLKDFASDMVSLAFSMYYFAL